MTDRRSSATQAPRISSGARLRLPKHHESSSWRIGIRQVFADVRYVLLAAATGLAVFILATWLPNLGLVWQIAASESIPLADKVNVLASLVGSIGTNFTVFAAVYTIAIAVLFGANVATLVHYFRLRRRRFVRPAGQAGAAASLGGLASGVFGVGCAACGTFVLGPVLAFFGAGGLIVCGGDKLVHGSGGDCPAAAE